MCLRWGREAIFSTIFSRHRDITVLFTMFAVLEFPSLPYDVFHAHCSHRSRLKKIQQQKLYSYAPMYCIKYQLPLD